ncbi:NAD(P)-dependent oxidoreductase [Autumnicola musiva]|uniref:NAD(P)H-binding protein n=1 Tax=Autumnicola musiva TaxID=3075589 RepID=A0ABU3DAT2_9FLAO|nr:NAD(P)H-binding protein [Zunongwangia sp. F117]MDT0678644.1 NAD(P)H-binding protein [Zunongwangia sp. F117]
MKIAIIGAGGGIGLQTVIQALDKGHKTTALSRDTSTIPNHKLLTKINGSATSVSDLKQTIKNKDAVLITVGTKNKKNVTLFSEIANAIIQATDEMNFTSPVITITGFGSGKSSNYLNFFMRIAIKFFLKEQYINKTLMEELLAKSSIKWEIVRPGMLTNRTLTKSYKVLPELEKGMKVNRISRKDVAHFLLSEAEKPEFIHNYVALTS